MCYEFPAVFERLDNEIVVSFPDLPEALTSGRTEDDAFREAMDALGAALAGYAVRGQPTPEPSPVRSGQVPVTPPPLIVAKLALRTRMRALGVSNVALAQRLGVSEAIVRRLVDPDHESKLSKVAQALAALGQHLVVDVRDTRIAAA